MGDSDVAVEGAVDGSGKVNKVRQDWRVFEDGVVAHQMQTEEFGRKVNWNRNDRRTARKDVPLAKVITSEEEERLQKERYEYLTQQKSIAERDAELAKQVLEEEARQQLAKERDRRAKEMQDEVVARKMQEKEQRRLERLQQEREIARQRKMLEQELVRQAHATDQELASYVQEGERSAEMEGAGRATQPKLLRTDGKVEDIGDFTDFYMQPDPRMNDVERSELQKLQDEELARLLQEQEHKRGGNVVKDRQKAIEEQDAELARLMQEQEKLKARKQRHRQRQTSQPAPQRMPSDMANLPPVLRSMSLDAANHQHPPAYPQKISHHGSQHGRHSADNVNNSALDQQRSPGSASSQNGVSVVRVGGGIIDPRILGHDIEEEPAHDYLQPLDDSEEFVAQRGAASGQGRPEARNRSPDVQPARMPSGGMAQSRSLSPSEPGAGVQNSDNLFSAIDPTFQQQRQPNSLPREQAPPVPPTDARANAPNSTLPPPPRGAPGRPHEHFNPVARDSPESPDGDGYCDLDDFTPVGNQRRTSGVKKPGGKKNSCKQQ